MPIRMLRVMNTQGYESFIYLKKFKKGTPTFQLARWLRDNLNLLCQDEGYWAIPFLVFSCANPGVTVKALYCT